MIVEFQDLIKNYCLNITGVLHVGAHHAEEVEDYAKLNVPIWWVEANPGSYDRLVGTVHRYAGQEVIMALIAETDGKEYLFNVTNNDGMSSSIFDFGTHSEHSPDTVYLHQLPMRGTTIDAIMDEHSIKANFLNLDIQGAELRALKGAPHFLRQVDYIYTEVSTGPTYIGGALMYQLDDYLASDFRRAETSLYMHAGTHGDAFYVRTTAR